MPIEALSCTAAYSKIIGGIQSERLSCQWPGNRKIRTPNFRIVVCCSALLPTDLSRYAIWIKDCHREHQLQSPRHKGAIRSQSWV